MADDLQTDEVSGDRVYVVQVLVLPVFNRRHSW